MCEIWRIGPKRCDRKATSGCRTRYRPGWFGPAGGNQARDSVYRFPAWTRQAICLQWKPTMTPGTAGSCNRVRSW